MNIDIFIMLMVVSSFYISYHIYIFRLSPNMQTYSVHLHVVRFFFVRKGEEGGRFSKMSFHLVNTIKWHASQLFYTS